MILELNRVFKEYLYSDTSHTYIKGDQKLQSVTKFLGSLKEPFNRDYWSVYKAYEFSGLTPKYNWRDYQNQIITLEDGTIITLDQEHNIKVTPEQVLLQWSLDSMIGKTRGSYIHLYLETKENRLLDYPQMPYLPQLDLIQSIKFYDSMKVGMSLADEFLEYQKLYLVPIAMEYTVGNMQLGLAGRFDRLYYNLLEEEYQIWDFKTDKKITKSNSNKLKIFNLPDCEFSKYSLQLSLYKYMIEEAIGEKIGKSYIVHFDIKNKEWNTILASDYTKLIKEKAQEISWLS